MGLTLGLCRSRAPWGVDPVLVLERWMRVARRALRLAFKRRCWHLLGLLLRAIKDQGRG
jgi:hypothetical protein